MGWVWLKRHLDRSSWSCNLLGLWADGSIRKVCRRYSRPRSARLLTTWVTFTPCFLWIFLGGPYIEKLRGNIKLTTALSAITAAVVGVVLNLAVWFAIMRSFPVTAPSIGSRCHHAVAFVGMLRWRWDIIPVVLSAGALGIAGHVLGIR